MESGEHTADNGWRRQQTADERADEGADDHVDKTCHEQAEACPPTEARENRDARGDTGERGDPAHDAQRGLPPVAMRQPPRKKPLRK
jgi:hypothetical protein